MSSRRKLAPGRLLAVLWVAMPSSACETAGPGPCEGPLAFEGTWTAHVKEAHASGTYTMKLSPNADFPKTGSHTFDRDVTNDATAPIHPGCREIGHFVGSWGVSATDGSFWIVNSPWSGERSGCSNPADNKKTVQGNATEPDKSLITGKAVGDACSMEIKATKFSKASGI